jgi:hypothetical protein
MLEGSRIMESEMLISAAAALSFAAMIILWALAPTQPAPATMPARAPVATEAAV